MSRTHSQLGRIAHLLGVENDDIVGFDDISEDDLRTFHDQISHTLFDAHHARFAKVAALSKVIPGPLAGKLSERFIPPALAAHIAVLLEPARAEDLVKRVSIDYLCDVTLHMDPVRAKPLAQAISTDRVGEVARALFDRREYAAMAEFAGTVTVDMLYAALAVATPHDLLAVAPLMVWNDNIDAVLSHLPAAQIQDIVHGLTPAELADLALALDPSRFGPIVHAIPVEVVEGIARELYAQREYEAMSRFVHVVTADMMHAAFDAASPHDLLAVVPLLEWNETLDRVIAELPKDQIRQIVSELTPNELAELALGMDPLRFGPIVQVVPTEIVGEVARRLFELKEYDAMARFVHVVTVDMLHAALDAATAADLLAVLPLLEWNDNLERFMADLAPARITGMVAKMTPAELAELATSLDVSRYAPIVHATPLDMIAATAHELFGRKEYEAVARFVDVVATDMLHAAMATATPDDLIAMAPLLDWNDAIDDAVERHFATMAPEDFGALTQAVSDGRLTGPAAEVVTRANTSAGTSGD